MKWLSTMPMIERLIKSYLNCLFLIELNCLFLVKISRCHFLEIFKIIYHQIDLNYNKIAYAKNISCLYFSYLIKIFLKKSNSHILFFGIYLYIIY